MSKQEERALALTKLDKWVSLEDIQKEFGISRSNASLLISNIKKRSSTHDVEMRFKKGSGYQTKEYFIKKANYNNLSRIFKPKIERPETYGEVLKVIRVAEK